MNANARAARASAGIANQQARNNAARGTSFSNLRVKIKGDRVTTLPGLLRTRDLGPLAGSCAGVVGKSRMTGPRVVTSIVVGGAASTSVTTFVQFADGSKHERKSSDERQARKEAARFNALSDAATLASDPGVPFRAGGARQCQKCEFTGKSLRDLVTHTGTEHPNPAIQAARQKRGSRQVAGEPEPTEH